MMKKVKHLWFLSLLFIAACGGDDTPNPGPGTGPGTQPTLVYQDCLVSVSDALLEVVTWNIKNFPVAAEGTVDDVRVIIEEFNPDVIAVQEINDAGEFGRLVAELDDWEGQVINVPGSSLRLGYLYKTTEITVLSGPSNLFIEDTPEFNNAFTSVRRPLHMKIRHTSGVEVDLINVHLKCCDGSEDRRRSASELIKQYIDENLADKEVILLGDFNDEIVDSRDNVFQNFINDSDNYKFSTMPIAQGADDNWSFPSWPSMIDHILITNELFESEVNTQVLRPGDCVDTYPNRVSDHRPVMISLQTQ